MNEGGEIGVIKTKKFYVFSMSVSLYIQIFKTIVDFSLLLNSD